MNYLFNCRYISNLVRILLIPKQDKGNPWFLRNMLRNYELGVKFKYIYFYNLNYSTYLIE